MRGNYTQFDYAVKIDRPITDKLIKTHFQKPVADLILTMSIFQLFK